MSADTKKSIQEAQEYFKRVQTDSQKYTSIPDKQLSEKIRKVGDGAGEVVKHIGERTGKQG